MKPKTYIDKKLTPPKAFFDWCYSQIHTFKWSNKRQTIWTSDRIDCDVIEKRLTSRTRLTFFDKFYTFAIVLVTKKRIEIQTYAFYSEIDNWYQHISFRLSNFEQFANDRHVQVTEDRGQYFYGMTQNLAFSGNYTGTRFFDNDWKEKVKTISELRYLNFPLALDRADLANIYKYRSEIEFLQKINARTLSFEVMYPDWRYLWRDSY